MTDTVIPDYYGTPRVENFTNLTSAYLNKTMTI